MAKARDEAQALEHMGLQARGNKLSGIHRKWTREKHRALHAVLMDWCFKHNDPMAPRPSVPPLGVVEVGVGDAAHILGFEGKHMLDYLGYDGVQEVVDRANGRGLDVELATFGEIVRGEACLPEQCDVFLLLDVLYHVPDEEVHDRLLQLAFATARHYVLLSYATDISQQFDGGSRPGDPGFCWFPRPFPGAPDGWEEIHAADADTMQRQRLAVFRRAH